MELTFKNPYCNINRLNTKKNHKVISFDIKKGFEKIQHLFMINLKKTTHQVSNRRELPQLDKEHLQKPLHKIPYLVVKAWMLSSKIRNKTRMSTFTTII